METEIYWGSGGMPLLGGFPLRGGEGITLPISRGHNQNKEKQVFYESTFFTLAGVDPGGF